jgi:hypothetical protein
MFLLSKKPKTVQKIVDINIHWSGDDPFTFVSHHHDQYPKGNQQLAPPLQLISGRNLGRDYQERYGFRMYHGRVVPGFPMHAHWGYETVTIAEKGFVDHFDTEGNHGRYGNGDVQWTLASSRYEHCEMYPLLDQENDNPVHITQIMINLPLDGKNRPNHVNNVWSGSVPVFEEEWGTLTLYCGEYGGKSIYSPNPGSWAAPENMVRIMKAVIRPGGELSLDRAADGIDRNVYFVSGSEADLDGTVVKPNLRFKMKRSTALRIRNGGAESEFWILEGRPIGEKQAAFGPVILKDLDEVRRSMDEIRIKEFQEWPWGVMDVTNPIEMGRELHREDGSVERPEGP